MDRRRIRVALAIASAVVLVALALRVALPFAVVALFGLDPERYSGLPVVLALPPGFDHAPRPHYTGPHPSQLAPVTDPYDYPIAPGEIGPVAPLSVLAGPLKYPFLCMTVESGLGQPEIDNDAGVGMAVRALDDAGAPTGEVRGYSRDCLLRTRVEHLVLQPGVDMPVPVTAAAIAGEGTRLRVETGTINRFPYLIVTPAGPDDTPARPDARDWNGRLIYQFEGGSGIGRRQGTLRRREIIRERRAQLEAGYAIAYSTGNRTSNHYDVGLAADTARRVKRQFVALYGAPRYTVGIGGSGGALQQYLLGQNDPGLLDAAIALYSYPDMVTQSIYALDCELLEYYFDVLAADDPTWRDWANRQWIEGLPARADLPNEFARIYAVAKLLRGRWPGWSDGLSECVAGWRGLTPLVHNPRYAHFMPRFVPNVAAAVHWSYWEDLRHVYGVRNDGYARDTWDNVGVQYGLEALREGHITPAQFLDLNARIGGWKSQAEMQPERYWRFAGPQGGALAEISPWSHHNARWSTDEGRTPAPRTAGDLAAIEAAYRSGQVFVGHIAIPVLDVRHYLDDALDMHHLSASFQARLRMLRARGHADNQVIWVTRKPHTPIGDAFRVVDEWISELDGRSAAAAPVAPPPDAVDTCFAGDGTVIARGRDVWDGAWNGRAPGQCARQYRPFGTPRTAAGGDHAGDVFKCHLQPVASALERGLYGDVDMRAHRARLETIFPDGVCDPSRGDAGRPLDLLGGGAAAAQPRP